MSNQQLQGEARFELKRQLADTLQGRIYSAIDKNTGSYVVVKETWKQLVQLGKSRDGHRVPENFDEEKKVLTYLSRQPDCNPGFARLIDEWTDDQCYLYAMEMCSEGELFEYIKGMHADGQISHYTRKQARMKQEPLKESNEWIKLVQHMFRQIVSCVAWMHSKGVCHLDLSLENTMIASRSKKHGNVVKIIDFGLAVYDPNATFDKKEKKRVGKTGYMAPEVMAKKVYDPRAADIWSLGVMLFMMLIGAPPFPMPVPSNAPFNFIVNQGRLMEVLKHWKRLRLVTEDALDLMNKIFKYEAKRIKMEDILKHPFVNLVDSKKEQSEKVESKVAVKEKENEKQVSKPKKEVVSETTVSKPAEQPQAAQPQTPINEEATEQTPQEAQVEEIKDIRSHTFKSQIAQSFADRLKIDSLPIDQLKIIMEDVEKAHNPLNEQHPKETTEDCAQSKTEIEAIYRYLVKQMAAQQPEQQKKQKHKVERSKISDQTPLNY